VKKTVLVYGLLGGVLIAALQLIQYRFLVLEHSLEIYGGLVALLFSALGIWLGLKLTRVREVPVIVEVKVEAPFQRNEARVAQLGLPRASWRFSRLSRPGSAPVKSGNGSSSARTR